MAYPATKVTFSDPDGTTRMDTGVDHAALHTSNNTVIEALEDTVGTTAGTNIFKNFTAGDFPARINATNVLQQAVSGTINNSTLGTPTFVLGSDAQGDIYYKGTAGIARLAPSTAGYYLQTGGAGANPSWASGPSADGWNSASGTWVYDSSTTITVPTDATNTYDIGDKIKLTQSATTKYFIVTAVAATTLTVTGGSDYTVANAAITNVYYSKQSNPHGFPHWFNWTISYTFDGTGPTGPSENTAKFNVIDRTVFFKTKAVYATAGTGVSAIYFDLPITQVGSASEYNLIINGMVSTGVAGQLPTNVATAVLYGVGSDEVYLRHASADIKTVLSDGFYQI